jgi:hypothetical protein
LPNISAICIKLAICYAKRVVSNHPDAVSGSNSLHHTPGMPASLMAGLNWPTVRTVGHMPKQTHSCATHFAVTLAVVQATSHWIAPSDKDLSLSPIASEIDFSNGRNYKQSPSKASSETIFWSEFHRERNHRC